jgi:hypothetical protein
MMTNTKKLSAVLVAFMTMLILEPLKAHAQQSNPPDKAFSFAVYGDSRSMMYLPYRQDQEAEARQLMVDMFELVLPAKVAPEVVKKDVRLIYDPTSKNW